MSPIEDKRNITIYYTKIEKLMDNLKNFTSNKIDTCLLKLSTFSWVELTIQVCV